MNLLSPAPLANLRADDVVQQANGSATFNFSNELSCQYDRPTGVLWSTWTPRGIPCFSTGLLHDLERGSQVVESHFTQAEDRPLTHAVIRSGIPNVYNLGGDLGHFLRLIEQRDRARLTEYARAAIYVAYRNYTAHNLPGVTMVALLEGDALGGGLESALSCNVVIAERHIKAGFPEVLFDMFPGMGAQSFLSRRVGRRTMNDMIRTGRQFRAEELHEMGVVDFVVDTGQGVAAVQRLVRQRAGQASAHAAMNQVDRLLQPVTLQELSDIVRLWVDCAMNLSERGQQWMRRLHQQQVKMFGRALGVAS